MGTLFTDLGLALLAANRAAGLGTIVDKVCVGTLTAGNRYDAVETQTTLEDNNPLELVTDFDIGSSGPNVTYAIRITSSPALRASEVGLYVGNTLVLVVANQADDLFNKGLNTNALISISYSLTNGVPDNTTVTVDINISNIAKATDNQARNGNNDTNFVTARGVRLFFESNEPDLNDAIPVGVVTPFLGEDHEVPVNWLVLKGQIVTTADYPDLEALCRGKFGNSAARLANFILPNTRHRTIVGAGGSPSGGVGNQVGDVGGAAVKTIGVNEMPSHNHNLFIDNANGFTGTDRPPYIIAETSSGLEILPGWYTSHSGGNQSISLMQPSLVLSYIVKAR